VGRDAIDVASTAWSGTPSTRRRLDGAERYAIDATPKTGRRARAGGRGHGRHEAGVEVLHLARLDDAVAVGVDEVERTRARSRLCPRLERRERVQRGHARDLRRASGDDRGQRELRF